MMPRLKNPNGEEKGLARGRVTRPDADGAENSNSARALGPAPRPGVESDQGRSTSRHARPPVPAPRGVF